MRFEVAGDSCKISFLKFAYERRKTIRNISYPKIRRFNERKARIELCR